VLRNFFDHVEAVLQPLELDARRRRPNGFFTFLTVISITHRSLVPCGSAMLPSLAAVPLVRGGTVAPSAAETIRRQSKDIWKAQSAVVNEPGVRRGALAP
jgi:hypothetical protein